MVNDMPVGGSTPSAETPEAPAPAKAAPASVGATGTAQSGDYDYPPRSDEEAALEAPVYDPAEYAEKTPPTGYIAPVYED